MKKVILAAAMSLPAFSSFSQAAKRAGEFYMGINIGMNYSMIRATVSDPVSILNASTVNGLGYRLGLVGGMQVSRHLSIEAKPALSFNDSKLGIIRADNSKETYEQQVT